MAEVNGRTRVFAGSYDHNVYCLDAESGEELWRFTTGCLVKAAPVFAVIDGRPMLFVASSDRAFYGLDAETGRKLWTLETYSWTYTVGESLAGSPLVADVDGKPVLFATMWNGDKRPLRTTQIGELFAIAPQDGALLWRRKLSSAKLSPPTLATVNDRTVVFAGSEDGTLYASDARTGEALWKYTSGHRIDAAPVFTRIAGQPIVIIVNAFGMMRALSAANGSQIWQYKCGHEILSTPAIVAAAGKLMVIVGASDRCVHAIDAKTGERMWTFQTGKYVVASPAIGQIRGRATVFINSLDNNLYVLDAETGCEIMRFASGDMLWPYETRGISIWSSPSLGTTAEGNGILLYPGHDGKLYAFTTTAADKPRDGDAALTGWSPGQQTRPNKARHATGAVLWLPPTVAGALMLAGILIVLFPTRRHLHRKA
jgi:outer membrane protein assembly factor BamB